jgi:nitric oxide reductase subunit B
MKYETQRIAYWYFACALALFVVQVLVGALAATVYAVPNFLTGILPFNILRMIHTNALIVWLLLGFFGSAYYLIPEEAERDIESPMLAYLQLAILMIGALGAVIGYTMGIHEGREFLEQPLWVKIGIVVGALIFLYNISLTVLRGRRTAITNVLLLGLWGVAIFFLFAFYNPSNLAVDKLYWWYIVHLWVEGVWELVMASVMAFLRLRDLPARSTPAFSTARNISPADGVRDTPGSHHAQDHRHNPAGPHRTLRAGMVPGQPQARSPPARPAAAGPVTSA